MTDSSSTGLKVIVERAVRPVRTALARKRRMREELLAHVTSVFNEEFERIGEEDAALAATARRFGNPGEVAAQLEAAVSRRDQACYWIERLTRRRCGESLPRHAGRWALLITMLNVIATSIGSLPAFFVAENRHNLSVVLKLLPMIAVETLIMTFVFVLLTHAMRRTMYCRRGLWILRLVAVVIACCLAPLAVTFPFYWVVSGDVEISLALMPRSMPLVPLIPIIVMVAAWQIELERRYIDEWAALEVE